MSFTSKIGSLASRAYGWSAARAVDQYFEYTTLLLPGNGTNGAQNNTFLDGSTNNFTITRNGNTTQGTFSPFSQTGWGNYFDGTGDWLTFTGATTGSGNFTTEAWVYLATLRDYQVIFDNRATGATATGYAFGVDGAGKPYMYTNNGFQILSSIVITANSWNHVALVRNGTTITIYVNGVSGGTYTSSANFSDTNNGIGVSPTYTPTSQYFGYISNLRIVNGTAVYTSAFTPPTSPLTAISGTSLLTCQSNRFIDNSTNNFTITKNGDTRVVAFSPFNPTASWSAASYGGSGYFDGSGDYLSVADNTNLRFGTNAFTIQAWVYRNASGAAHSIIAKGGASTGYVLQVTSTNVLRFTHGTTNVDTTTTIPASAWTHVAAVRTNTSTNGFQLYINGVSSATATVATDFNQTDTLYIGSDRSAANVMNGYISGLKYTNGTAESISVPTGPPTATTNVVLLTNFTNAGIYDATSKNDLETVGNAQISNAVTPMWGSTSIKFNGTTDYLSAPDSPLFSLGSANFTIECWFRSGSFASGQFFVSQWNSASYGYGFSIANSTTVKLEYYSSGVYTNRSYTVPTFSTNTWYHIAWVRYNGTTTVYIDGVARGTPTSDNVSITDSTRPLLIGLNGDGNNQYFNGYIQDLRITPGIARYTANFTAPTAAFPTL